MKSELPGILALWKPATVTVGDWLRSVASFGRVSVVRRRGLPAGEVSGHAIWGTFVGATPMALCWEWAMDRPSVVVLSNPMGVMSNVTLVDDRGGPIGHGQTLLELNRALYELDWQEQVAAEVQSGAAASSGPLPHRPPRRAKAVRGLHGLHTRMAA